MCLQIAKTKEVIARNTVNEYVRTPTKNGARSIAPCFVDSVQVHV